LHQTQHLLFLLLCPRVAGKRELALHHIHKAGLRHLFLELGCASPNWAYLDYGFKHKVIPSFQVSPGKRIVNALEWDIVFLELDPASRVEVLIAGLEYVGGVSESSDHEA
jgi:hypothetical protein